MSNSKFQLLPILWTTFVLFGCSNSNTSDSPKSTEQSAASIDLGRTPVDDDVSRNSLTPDEVATLGGVEEFVSEAYVEQTIATRDTKHWYSVGIAGRKLGYTVTRMRKTVQDEPGVYMISSVLHLGATGDSRVVSHSAFFATAPYKTVEIRTSEVTPAGRISRTFFRKGKKTLVETVVDGKRQADSWAPDMCGSLRSVLGEVAPEFGRITSASRGKACTFVAEDQKQHVVEVQINSMGTRLVKGKQTDVVTLQSKKRASEEWIEVTITKDGTSLETTRDPAMFIRLEDRESATSDVVDVDVNTSLVKLESPLGDSSKIKELKLHATFSKGYRPPDSTPNQLFEKQPDGSYHLSIFSVPGATVLLEDEVEALKSTPEIDSDAPEIAALAKKLTVHAKSDSEKVATLTHWVYSNLDGAYSKFGTASQVLSHKAGGSMEHSLLLVALLRAVKVPARKLFGLVYMGDETSAFGRHVWVEVALDGRWVQVDPSRDEVIGNATHINLGLEGTMKNFGTMTLEKV